MVASFVLFFSPFILCFPPLRPIAKKGDRPHLPLSAGPLFAHFFFSKALAVASDGAASRSACLEKNKKNVGVRKNTKKRKEALAAHRMGAWRRKKQEVYVKKKEKRKIKGKKAP